MTIWTPQPIVKTFVTVNYASYTNSYTIFGANPITEASAVKWVEYNQIFISRILTRSIPVIACIDASVAFHYFSFYGALEISFLFNLNLVDAIGSSNQCTVCPSYKIAALL